jgi:acylphosphatase
MQMAHAISATVTGKDEGVGFRAMIMKEAIRYNLAGSAENEPNDVVKFTLQGKADRIDAAIAKIREGTARSEDIQVNATQGTVVHGLKAFSVVDWTSQTRNITNPYNLTFNLRSEDNEISKDDAKDVWHQILRNTLQGDDLAKLRPDD